MGVVWLAYDEYLHREVAVKEILPRGQQVTDTDPQVRRALREARAAAKLSKHPGIVTVHDVVTGDDGLPWIVMEVLHGHSLRSALDNDGPMPVGRAARIAAQVLEALDYAHNERVLHRDVKPGNTGDVRFDRAEFSDTTWFHEAEFVGSARFQGATFASGVWFDKAKFDGHAAFNGAKFAGEVRLDGAEFPGTATFGGAAFSEASAQGKISFSRVSFAREVPTEAVRFWSPPTAARGCGPRPGAGPST